MSKPCICGGSKEGIKQHRLVGCLSQFLQDNDIIMKVEVAAARGGGGGEREAGSCRAAPARTPLPQGALRGVSPLPELIFYITVIKKQDRASTRTARLMW